MLKWNMVKGYFYIKSIIYILFLLSYSTFIVNVFKRPEVHCSGFEKLLYNKENTNEKDWEFMPGAESAQENGRYQCQKLIDRSSTKFLESYDKNF